MEAKTEQTKNVENEKEVTLGIEELMPGVSSEEMKAMFFDSTALIEPGYKVWQLNAKGNRFYYRFNEKSNVEFYPSVTTIISATTPTSPWLIDWIASMGKEEAERYKNERAAYGTFMHAMFERYIIDQCYDLDNIREEVLKYIECEKLADNFINYVDDFKKDILAFAQFVKDYDVRPLAVEVALVHPEKGYAGMIDLPCTMLSKPGSKDRVIAIVDFKSGRKAFYEDYEIQLGMYRDMWNVNFPDKPVERIFNFSPKDWRKEKPTYNLKDQTNSPNIEKIPYLLELAKIEFAKRESTFMSIGGSITMEDEDFSNNITIMDMEKLVESRQKQKSGAEKAATESTEPVQEQKPEPKPVRKAKINKKAVGDINDNQEEEKPAKATKKAEMTAKTNLLNDDPEI